MRSDSAVIEQYFGCRRNQTITGALLVVLFLMLYVVILGARPLFIPDEMRYGEIAREMLATGDWIVPRLNGLLYFEKPPFGYWLNSLSLAIFGENPFAVRFASAFATAIAAAIVFVLGRLFFESRAIPFVATFIYLTTLEVQAIGTFSVLDPTFAAVLNGGILVFAVGVYSEGKRRNVLLAFSGILFGLAFLTKGFLAFALPVLVLVPWLIMRREYRLLTRHAWIAVVSALLVIAPWALAIHSREPDFWRYFFWVEHVQRFASENAQHKAPFYYFLLYLPALAFPWIFLLPSAVTNLRKIEESTAKQGVLSLLTLWATVPFVFFSIASGKLATYILPCFVPFSLILAAGLSDLATSVRGVMIGIVMAGFASAAFLVALLIYVSSAKELVFATYELPKELALYGSVFLAIVSLALARGTRRHEIRLGGIGLSIVPFMLALPLSMPGATLGSKAPEAFLEDTYSQVSEDAILVTNGSLVRAMSWSTRRTDIYVIENGGETTYGLSAHGGEGRFLEPPQLRELVDSVNEVLIVCKGQCSSESIAVIPEHAVRSSYGGFFAYHIKAAPEFVHR